MDIVTEMKVNETIANQLSDTATDKAVLKQLSARLRGRDELDLQRLKRGLIKLGFNPDEKDYESFWHKLEKSGAGTFKPARGQRPMRFQCSRNIRQVAAEILAKSTGTDKVQVAKEKRAPRSKKEKIAYQRVGQLVVIPLRSDFNVKLTLPSKLTDKEVKQLQETIAKLAE